MDAPAPLVLLQANAPNLNVSLLTLGALAWDWLMSMPDEYRILSIGGFSTSKVAYFAARVVTLACCITSCIFEGAPISNCEALIHIHSSLIVLALATTNVLFLVRVRAVYGKSARITAFFALAYLSVLGSMSAVPFALHAAHIPTTGYCTMLPPPSWITTPMILNAINDTLVFLAISYRVTAQSLGGSGCGLRRFLRGAGVPRVARALLHSGQLCYFATFAMNLALLVLAGARPPLTTLLLIPVVALENAMSARVHRAVVLGLIADSVRPTTVVLTTFVRGDDTATAGLGTHAGLSAEKIGCV
ncbi:hypothetical protein HWV62_23512 [Athelia sp. TMB]|nr:hypothetical protein HWV62_23512 [Athelia sp. TMB]